MGTNTVGLTGLLSAPDTSSGAVDQTGFDLYRLIETSTDPFSCTINGTGEAFASVGFGTGSVQVAKDQLQGLGAWTGSFTARYPRGAPAVGHQGLATFGSGYTLGMTGWSLTINAEAYDDTAQASTPPTWRDFLAGQITATGSFDCSIDDTTAVTLNTAGAATFRMNTETTTDNTLAGNIVITGFSPAVVQGQKNVMRYTFAVNGNLTSAGDNALFAAGTLATPTMTEIVLRAKGDRDYTGDAFWTSVQIGAQIGSPITATVGFQGSGALVAG